MVCVSSERSVQERFARRSVAATLRLNCNEDGINFRESLGIVAAQSPPAVCFVVHVQNAETQRLSLVRFLTAPRLKRGILHPRLAAQVERIKDQRLPFRIEYSAKRSSSIAVPFHVEYIRDVKLARTHNLANVTIG